MRTSREENERASKMAERQRKKQEEEERSTDQEERWQGRKTCGGETEGQEDRLSRREL